MSWTSIYRLSLKKVAVIILNLIKQNMHTSERAATLWDLTKKRAVTHQKVSSAALVNFSWNPGNIPSPTIRKRTVGETPRHFSPSFFPRSVVWSFVSKMFYNVSIFGAWLCLCLALRLQRVMGREHCGNVTSGHFHQLFFYPGTSGLLCRVTLTFSH